MPRRRSGKKIDFVHWTGFAALFGGQAAGTIGVSIFAALHEPETLLRLRGNMIAWVDGSLAPGVNAHIGVGFILVPEGTGSTVLWSPISDSNAPWFWYTKFFVGYEEMVTDVIDVPLLTAYRETIDSKAMRRARADVEVQLVLENVTVNGALSVNASVVGRVLLGS